MDDMSKIIKATADSLMADSENQNGGNKHPVIKTVVKILTVLPAGVAAGYLIGNVVSGFVPVQAKPVAKVACIIGGEVISLYVTDRICDYYGGKVDALIDHVINAGVAGKDLANKMIDINEESGEISIEKFDPDKYDKMKGGDNV